MGLSICCHFSPPPPGLDPCSTDGKNLFSAFVGSALGGLDLDSLAGNEEADMPDDAPDVFSPLDPFIDKESAMLGHPFTTLHSPSEGLAAIEATIAGLRSPAGSIAVPDLALRDAAIADLQAYAGMLNIAHKHGSRFTFYFQF